MGMMNSDSSFRRASIRQFSLSRKPYWDTLGQSVLQAALTSLLTSAYPDVLQRAILQGLGNFSIERQCENVETCLPVLHQVATRPAHWRASRGAGSAPLCWPAAGRPGRVPPRRRRAEPGQASYLHSARTAGMNTLRSVDKTAHCSATPQTSPS